MFRNMKLAPIAATLAFAGLSQAAAAAETTTGSGALSIFGQGLAMIAVLLVVYLFPLVIALGRKHNNRLAIGMLNLFLGWTFFGWIGALIWACTNNREAK